jgi:hypothetical protein
MNAKTKSRSSKTWGRIVAQHLRRRGPKVKQVEPVKEVPERPRFSLFLASFRR